MSKKLNKVERLMLDTTDRSKYKVYRCPTHKLFAQKNEIATGICPYKCGFVAESEFYPEQE